MNETTYTNQGYRSIEGLGEALFSGNTKLTRELLTNISAGEIIRTWGMELLVSTPTPDEVELMKKSLMQRKELGLIVVGDEKREISGKAGEISDQECITIVDELKQFSGPKSFTHTHWDDEYNPIPSGADLTMYRVLSQPHLGYRFRVISWLPGYTVFEIVGEYTP